MFPQGVPCTLTLPLSCGPGHFSAPGPGLQLFTQSTTSPLPVSPQPFHAMLHFGDIRVQGWAGGTSTSCVACFGERQDASAPPSPPLARCWGHMLPHNNGRPTIATTAMSLQPAAVAVCTDPFSKEKEVHPSPYLAPGAASSRAEQSHLSCLFHLCMHFVKQGSLV